MAKRMSMISIADRIPDEASAYRFVEDLRWPDGPVCAHCGHNKAYYLRPENGRTRKTRTGSDSARRVFKCANCKKQFSVLTNTIMHGTRIPIRKWCLVIFEMISSKNGISAREIERRYEVTAESAWFMTMRIREAMKIEPLAGVLTGTIIADETYIGGREKNRHKADRERGKSGRGTRRVPVLSLVNKETGEVRSRVVPDVTGATLRKAIEEHVNPLGSVLHTDAWAGYKPIGRQFDAHETVDHGAEEYVRDGITTNYLEGFFSQLKRSLDGTHHHVSPTHLGRYLAEFDFRHTTRKLDDATRMEELVSRFGGRRLSYRPSAGW